MASRELNERFIDLFRTMAKTWRALPPPPGVHIPAPITRAAVSDVYAVGVLQAWMVRVLRTGEAALVLHEQGFDAETPPLTRSLIEHAVALFWLEAERGAAYQSLTRKQAASARRMEEAQKHGWELDEATLTGIKEIVATETDEGIERLDTLWATAHQAQKYGLGSLYQAWLVETGYCHPRIDSARPYVDAVENEEGGSIHLLHEPKDVGIEVPAVVAIATHTALIPVGRLHNAAFQEQVKQWREKLNELGQALAEERAQDPQVT